MKSVLISIHPKWCELIASGKKTIEVRKTKPKLETPFKVYIYETKGKTEIPTFIDEEGHAIYQGKGQVIGEFVCNNIDWHGLSNLVVEEDAEHTLYGTCLTKEEVLNYLGYQKGTNIYACKNYDFYGWHISNLVIYDKPKELSEFQKPCIRDCDCGGCENAYWTHENGFEGCMLEEGLKRPPQSWCYVESEAQGNAKNS